MRHQFVPDRAIAAIAERQGGVVAHRQLLACGLSASAIHRRVRPQRLGDPPPRARRAPIPPYRGVFAVGHRVVGVVGPCWAAVLACGDVAVLSHRAAASAWDIRRSSSPVLDVTVGRGGRARRAGLRIHTSMPLPADEVTRLDGLPITTPARTLLDLSAARIRNLDAALDRAELLRLIDFAELHALLARYPGRPGTRSLNSAVIPVPRPSRRPIQARTAGEQALQRPRSPATARQLQPWRESPRFLPAALPARRRGRFLQLAALAGGVERRPGSATWS